MYAPGTYASTLVPELSGDTGATFVAQHGAVSAAKECYFDGFTIL